MLARGSGVLWHEMRVGKTRTVLHAFNELLNQGRARDLVVVAPATIRAVWKEEAEEMSLDLTWIDVNGTKDATKRLSPDPAGWPEGIPRCYLLNPELLPHWLGWFQQHLETERFALVADESHMYLRCPNGQTQRSRAFDELAKGTDFVWELSGTWYVRSALDIYWQLRPFGPSEPFFYTKKACYKVPGCGKCFACQYSHASYNAFSATNVAYNGITNEDQLLARLPMVSVVREEDIREIAIPDRFPVWVGEGPTDWNPDLDLDDAAIEEAMSELVRDKILLTAKYIDQLREGELRYDEAIGQYEPIVIFGWHVAYTEGVARHLGAPVITGKTAVHERNRLRNEFADGCIPVLVGNLQSLGMGVDLSAARWFIYGEPYYDAAMHFQAEARGRGPKQRAKTLRHAYLLIRRSVDETVWRVRLQRGAAIERMYAAGRAAAKAARDAGGRYLEEAR
jgi:hypothetical protein